MEENNQQEIVEISKIDDVIYIRFSSSLFFHPNQYRLLPASIPVLDFVGEGLKENEDAIRIINVLGFTATVDQGTYWMLSAERAAVVATHLNFENMVDPSKLTVMGYGNQYPIAENETEEGRKQNRRVELIVVGNEADEGFDVTDALDAYYNLDEFPMEGSAEETYQPNPEAIQPTKPETIEPTKPETIEPTNPETIEPTKPETIEPTSPDTVPVQTEDTGADVSGVSPYEH